MHRCIYIVYGRILICSICTASVIECFISSDSFSCFSLKPKSFCEFLLYPSFFVLPSSDMHFLGNSYANRYGTFRMDFDINLHQCTNWQSSPAEMGLIMILKCQHLMYPSYILQVDNETTQYDIP